MTKSKPFSYFEQFFAKSNVAATLRFFVLFNVSHLSQRALLSYSRRSRSEERANERKQRCATRDAEAVSGEAKLRGQKMKLETTQKQDATAK